MTNSERLQEACEKLNAARQAGDLIEIEFAAIQIQHYSHLCQLDEFQLKEEARL